MDADEFLGDHEHPCPSAECVAALRRDGYDVPDEVDCCICWERRAQLMALP